MNSPTVRIDATMTITVELEVSADLSPRERESAADLALEVIGAGLKGARGQLLRYQNRSAPTATLPIARIGGAYVTGPAVLRDRPEARGLALERLVRAFTTREHAEGRTTTFTGSGTARTMGQVEQPLDPECRLLPEHLIRGLRAYWVNDSAQYTVTYCEGDVTVVHCADEATYLARRAADERRLAERRG